MALTGLATIRSNRLIRLAQTKNQIGLVHADSNLLRTDKHGAVTNEMLIHAELHQAMCLLLGARLGTGSTSSGVLALGTRRDIATRGTGRDGLSGSGGTFDRWQSQSTRTCRKHQNSQ